MQGIFSVFTENPRRALHESADYTLISVGYYSMLVLHRSEYCAPSRNLQGYAKGVYRNQDQ